MTQLEAATWKIKESNTLWVVMSCLYGPMIIDLEEFSFFWSELRSYPRENKVFENKIFFSAPRFDRAKWLYMWIQVFINFFLSNNKKTLVCWDWIHDKIPVYYSKSGKLYMYCNHEFYLRDLYALQKKKKKNHLCIKRLKLFKVWNFG